MADEHDDFHENNGAAKPNGFSSKKNIIFIILVAVLTFGIGTAAIVAGVSNTPENHLSRHMRAAERYMSEMNNERAVIEYQRVLEIDPMNVDAILGLADAYIGLKDINMALETLENGLGRVYGNVDIKQKLIELYFVVLEEKENVADYEAELKIYDRLLELAHDAERVIDRLCECLQAYIAVLLDKEMYDEIRELAERYRSVAIHVDFESILAHIQQIEEYRALVRDILTSIAASCMEEKYDNAFSVMQSEKYEIFLAKIDEITDINRVETAYGEIRIYQVDSEVYGKHMIYYGDFENGRRQGSGVWLGYYDKNNYMAKGTWENDLPQGGFTVREWRSELAEGVVYRVKSGNVDDGLWNGEVLWQFEEESGETMTFPVSFKNGKWVTLGQESDDGRWKVSEKSIESNVENGMYVDDEVNMPNGIVGFASD